VLHDAGQAGDGLGLVDGLAHEQRGDEVVDRQPGLGDETAQGRRAPEAAGPSGDHGGKATVARLPIASRVALAACLAVAACGGDDDGAATTTTPTTTVPTSGPTTTALPGDGIAAIEAVLLQLLVAAGELGVPGLVDVGYTPGSGCLDGTSASALVGTSLRSEEQGVAVLQELRGYDSVDAAAAAMAACATGTDVTEQVGADDARVADGGVVYARLTDVVTVTTTTGPGLDPVEVAAFAVGKLVAFLEEA
jgi:hypothetical protein